MTDMVDKLAGGHCSRCRVPMICAAESLRTQAMPLCPRCAERFEAAERSQIALMLSFASDELETAINALPGTDAASPQTSTLRKVLEGLKRLETELTCLRKGGHDGLG